MTPTWTPGMTLDALEREVILYAYRLYKTKVATANSLGIGLRTLDAKLEKYAAEDKAYEIKKAEAKEKENYELERARGNIRPPYNPPPILDDATELALSAEPKPTVKRRANG